MSTWKKGKLRRKNSNSKPTWIRNGSSYGCMKMVKILYPFKTEQI